VPRPPQAKAEKAEAEADVIVVGGGVIGTAIAWRAARAGRAVTLIDPGTDDKASLVAAGMLGPVSESVFGEQDLLTLNLHAVGRFPSFNAELEAASGHRTGLRTEGTLAVAYDNDDLAALDRLTEFRHSIGLAARRLTARECRRLEPFLAPSTRGGVLATGDLSVDNRRYLTALREAARKAGVTLLTGTVAAVQTGTARASVHARITAGDAGNNAADQADQADQTVTLSAANVVIAAGWATGSIEGLPDEIRKAIRPVKGQLLRLRHPALPSPRAMPPIANHTIRATVQGRDVYLVPREDGELVVGATQEERGDRDVTAGAVHDLLRDAMTALPAIGELILAEASAGLRPGTSDNGPLLGRVAAGSLIIAAGHFRNGILLSAATADAVAALLAGRDPDQAWTPFRPGRLA
jgi:glycine oxidase